MVLKKYWMENFQNLLTILQILVYINLALKALKIFNILEDKIDFNSIKIHENLKKKDKLNKISILFKKIEKND